MLRNGYATCPSLQKSSMYPELYPGISLIFYGNGDSLEHDFVLQAGVDPAQIEFRLSGAQAVGLNAHGDLVIHLEAGSLLLRRPVAYQEAGNDRTKVTASFGLAKDGTIGFRLGPYDRAHSLVIDPVFTFSTYLAGTGSDWIAAVAPIVPAISLRSDPPIPPIFQPQPQSNHDRAAAMMSLSRSSIRAAIHFCTPPTSVVWVTTGAGPMDWIVPEGFLSSTSSPESGFLFTGLTVDKNGKLIVGGITNASDFPTTAGSVEPTLPPPANPQVGPQHSFLSKIDLSIGAPSVCLNSESVAFGDVPAQTTGTQTLTLTNCGKAPLHLDSFVSSSLVGATGNCSNVAAGAACTITANYLPENSDPVSGTLTLSDNAAIPIQVVSFSGQGLAGKLVARPSPLDFGHLLLGTQGPQTNLTLSNAGDRGSHHLRRIRQRRLQHQRQHLHRHFDQRLVLQCDSRLCPLGFRDAHRGSRHSFQRPAESSARSPAHWCWRHTVRNRLHHIHRPSRSAGRRRIAKAADYRNQLLPRFRRQRSWRAADHDVSQQHLAHCHARCGYAHRHWRSAGYRIESRARRRNQQRCHADAVPDPAVSRVCAPLSERHTLRLQSCIVADLSNTILPINPATGKLGTPISVGNDPRKMAASDDDGTIQRVNLQTSTVERTFSFPSESWTLSAQSVNDMHVVPGADQSLVVAFNSILALYNDTGLVSSCG
jgi:hypothetical protein